MRGAWEHMASPRQRWGDGVCPARPSPTQSHPSPPQVFWPGQPKPVFFVASRGHHADIGGITPGSMPPHSTALQEEGAVFISFKLVQGGIFQEEGMSVPGWGQI